MKTVFTSNKLVSRKLFRRERKKKYEMSILFFFFIIIRYASDGGPLFEWIDSLVGEEEEEEEKRRSDSDEAARKKLKWLIWNQLVYISDSEWKQGKEREREKKKICSN